jgi:hypothetical protein
MPVNTIAMPRSSAAPITSSSRMLRRVDHGDRAVVGDDVESVAKGKERIGRNDAARKRQARVGAFDRGDSRRVDAAHLAGADAERARRRRNTRSRSI